MFNLIVIGITFYINLKNKFEKSGCENRESGVWKNKFHFCIMNKKVAIGIAVAGSLGLGYYLYVFWID